MTENVSRGFDNFISTSTSIEEASSEMASTIEHSSTGTRQRE